MAIMNVTRNVKNQFSDDKNLAMRINFYKKYTTNKYNFADWLFDKYDFKENMKILELGCGNGSHWDDKIETLPNGCSLVLSDFSEGMLDLVRKKFSTSENVSIRKIDIQEIPFENETFDVVIANHMLFHVPDLNKALLEVKRVLKGNGIFYSATDGNGGMRPFLHNAIVKFEPTSTAFTEQLPFNLQNGSEILSKYFKNVQRSSRKKVPFGIAQIGKSFRNEITPGNFTFRTREFEQMELEFFCKPDTDLEWFDYWKAYCKKFLLDLGLKEENLKFRDHEKEELSFYSKATCDVEYKFPFGWGELWGIADRTDYDLSRHMEHSKKSLEYLDPQTNEKYIPYVIEPSVGADRLFLSILCDSYQEETLENGDTRTVMKLHPAVAPYKVAVLPLTKKQSEKAEEVYATLAKHFSVEFDVAGQIGKRYRRQDAIGTPYCVTVDFDTMEDNAVTVRDRDTMEQVRLPIDQLVGYIQDKITF